ncbi:MAG: hypothetical protein KDK96_02625 [Chlamydiia bacterium]|nr:hypothetical protein [Chlamydiia bacterium]
MVSPLGSSRAFLTPTTFFTALAPTAASILLRPQFQSHLTNKKREFTYFLITAFIPTVMALRWHRVAWKITLPASALLSIASKPLSDRWMSQSTPPESPKKPTHTETPRPEVFLVPFKTHHALAIPTPSPHFERLPASTVEDVLQLVLPGDYTTTVSPEGTVTLSDPRIEKDVKAWVGKREDESLTSEDVASLQIYIRYRSLLPEQRTVLRQRLFSALAPLLEGKGEVTIPWMTGYSGESLSLFEGEDGAIILKGLSWHAWSLAIYEDGRCKYEDDYIIIENEDRSTLRPAKENYCLLTDQPGLKGEWVFELKQTGEVKHQLTTTKEHLNNGPAHLELLFFKIDQIQAFLKGEPTRQAEQVFQNCCELLGTLASEAESQAVVPHQQQTAMVPVEELPVDTTSFILGPIWSPVANSEDSTFNWIVTRSSSGQTTLQLQKKSAGRGMMGGTAERTVTLKTLETNKLELEIYKAGANDLEAYASSSVYHLERTLEGVRVTPQGRERMAHCIPFILGMREFHEERSSLQSMPEMQADADFMLKVLTTIADIKMSPDTMLVNPENRLVNLQGHSIPTDRVKLLSSQEQGAVGRPAIYYNAERREVSGPGYKPLLTGAQQPRAIESTD